MHVLGPCCPSYPPSLQQWLPFIQMLLHREGQIQMRQGKWPHWSGRTAEPVCTHSTCSRCCLWPVSSCLMDASDASMACSSLRALPLVAIGADGLQQGFLGLDCSRLTQTNSACVKPLVTVDHHQPGRLLLPN